MTAHEFEKLANKLPESRQAEYARLAFQETYREDFYRYAQECLGYKDLEWSVHGEAISTLESDAKRKIVVLPRGTFKSSLGSVAYPMWRLEKNPNLTILLDSELYTNSKNLLREIKGHYASKRYQLIFGNRVGSPWGEAEITVNNRFSGPNVITPKEASITVGGIGTTKVGQHYDLIIGDDYNSNSNSDTPEKCQKVIDHFKYNLSILNPGGEYLLIGTRYAEMDVIGFLLSQVLDEKYLAEGKLKRGSPQVEQTPDAQDLIGGI